ncbi:MAG: cell division protein ZapA [Bacteroidota bacterium]|nr:cell division protein ZapA [Bacteroidota bacterium]
MNDELLLLNLLIADRTYRIKVHPQDEEVVRKTAKTINDKLLEFKTMFAGKDMQDYLAMVLVWFATEQNATIVNQLNLDYVSSRLHTLEKMIDDVLEDRE